MKKLEQDIAWCMLGDFKYNSRSSSYCSASKSKNSKSSSKGITNEYIGTGI